jgi:hypothetical protein
VRFVRPGPRLLGAVLVASALLAASAAASPPPSYTYRDIAFVTVIGKGSVSSRPVGIHCPGACRAVFIRGTHVRLVPRADAGWRFVSFRSRWCGSGSRRNCAFDLSSPHECDGGVCPLGAFGVRVIFARKAT